MAADTDQTENVRTIVETTRREQGLPPTVTDAATLRRIARLLMPAR